MGARLKGAESRTDAMEIANSICHHKFLCSKPGVGQKGASLIISNSDCNP